MKVCESPVLRLKSERGGGDDRSAEKSTLRDEASPRLCEVPAPNQWPDLPRGRRNHFLRDQALLPSLDMIHAPHHGSNVWGGAKSALREFLHNFSTQSMRVHQFAFFADAAEQSRLTFFQLAVCATLVDPIVTSDKTPSCDPSASYLRLQHE